jgi:hypothetical protein
MKSNECLYCHGLGETWILDGINRKYIKCRQCDGTGISYYPDSCISCEWKYGMAKCPNNWTYLSDECKKLLDEIIKNKTPIKHY